MKITAICPSCKHCEDVNYSFVNYAVKCPKCETVFTIKEDPVTLGLNKRREERIEAPDASVHVNLVGDFPVVDISQSGIGLDEYAHAWPVSAGKTLYCDVRDKDEIALENIKVRIAHASAGVIGCVFEELKDGQKQSLTKLLQKQKFKAVKTTIMEKELKALTKRARVITLDSADKIGLTFWDEG